MIVLDKISKKFGTRTLFDDVSATFTPGNRYGLTGPNGSGKSTLLKIMMGEETASSGTLTMPKKVGFLKQSIEEFKDARVLDTAIMGNARLWEAMTERDTLYEGEITNAVGLRLGQLEEIIAEEDGYSAETSAEMLLAGMGIEIEHHEKLMQELPVDLQFRILLCQALFGTPEALLLDEPTNHLDLEAIGWLENFLHNYAGTLIMVSHDRHFLNAVATHIADVDYDTIIIYQGNYDRMLVTKTEVRERAEREAKSKEKKVAQLKEFISSFGAGTRASRAQSRLKEIKRLQPEELKKSNIQRPYIRFAPPKNPSGELVLRAKGISKSFDHLSVIRSFNIEILRGDKIAVIGNNGIGKSTLLKILAGKLQPNQGTVKYGHQVDIGYFPQNHADIIDKSEEIKAFEYLKRQKVAAYDQEIRGVMGKMLFSGDDAFKEISKLSGGETARLIFASLLIHSHNTLILDEPNNHLDLESVAALGCGLHEFKGSVIVASHDRELINEFAKKIIAIDSGGVHLFDGNLEEYLATRARS